MKTELDIAIITLNIVNEETKKFRANNNVSSEAALTQYLEAIVKRISLECYNTGYEDGKQDGKAESCENFT